MTIFAPVYDYCMCLYNRSQLFMQIVFEKQSLLFCEMKRIQPYTSTCLYINLFIFFFFYLVTYYFLSHIDKVQLVCVKGHVFIFTYQH